MYIQIDGRDVKFSTSVTFFYVYKKHFGEDLIQIIMPALQRLAPMVDVLMTGNIGRGTVTAADVEMLLEAFNEIEMTDLLNLIWATAKDANSEIAEPYEWMKQFDEFPVIDILMQLLPKVISSMMSKKKVIEITKKMNQTNEESILKPS